MRLDRLRLRDFRAHRDTTLTLARGVNVLFGPNGAGKTNVVEAVGYLGLGRSPIASTDAPATRIGAPYFEVEGEMTSDRGVAQRVRVAHVPGEGKRAFVNGAALERLADLVGRVPVVIMSPADHALTAGGPEERRRFLDTTLSQAMPAYLDDLVRYRRVLRQRNALLHEGRRGGSAPAALPAWDAELVALGSRVIERRMRFLGEFGPFVSEAFRLLELQRERADLTYQSLAPAEEMADIGAIGARFRGQLARVLPRELARGRTLVGPHLDEIVFRLNDMELRPFASQGQHRTFGLALRMGAFLFLRDRLDETPLLLLDDVFGPLDERRSGVLLNLLTSGALGQSVVTAARAESLLEAVDLSSAEHMATEIRDGAIAQAGVVPSA
jgi:DNA replication and repair protein RecF